MAADSDDVIDFGDLTPIRKVVSIKGPQGVRKFLVCEASSPAATQYRNAGSRSIKLVDGKAAGFEGLHDSEPLLVSLCVFDIQEDGVTPHAAPIGLRVVNSWPNRIVKQFYDLVRELSPGLVEKETVESLTKKIDEAVKQRAELIASEGKPDPKGPASLTEDTSGSAAS